MSISLIQRCSTTSWLKRTSSSANAETSIALRPQTPRSAVKTFVCSIMAGPALCLDGAIHAPCPEKPLQADLLCRRGARAKLRVDRTAQNQLVALKLDYGLNGYAQEIFRLYLLSYSGCDRPISGANCFGITQIQAHTTYVIQQPFALLNLGKQGWFGPALICTWGNHLLWSTIPAHPGHYYLRRFPSLSAS